MLIFRDGAWDSVVREWHEAAAETEEPSREFESIGRVSCSTW